MPREMTEKQREVLKVVQAYWSEHHVPPSLADLASALGVQRSTVHQHLLALKKKGYLEHIEGAGRTWRPVTEVGQAETRRIPLVGRVAAGTPVLAQENIEDWITVSNVKLGGELFALRVRGDSMIEGGILDGDTVIVRQQYMAADGEIVVALLDDEATVKKFRRDGDNARLEPMNPNYSPLVVRGDRFRIQGKVIGLRRHLDD